MTELFEAIDSAVEEYHTVTLPHIESQKARIRTAEMEAKRAQLEKLMGDIQLGSGSSADKI
jgi:hypothetical protein